MYSFALEAVLWLLGMSLKHSMVALPCRRLIWIESSQTTNKQKDIKLAADQLNRVYSFGQMKFSKLVFWQHIPL